MGHWLLPWGGRLIVLDIDPQAELPGLHSRRESGVRTCAFQGSFGGSEQGRVACRMHNPNALDDTVGPELHGANGASGLAHGATGRIGKKRAPAHEQLLPHGQKPDLSEELAISGAHPVEDRDGNVRVRQGVVRS